MQIDQIQLENFKNFKNLQVSFKPGVNLLVGSNGSGKTSVLEAICVAVGAFFDSQQQKMKRFIKFDEIRIERERRVPTTKVSASSASISKSWSRTINSNTRSNTLKDAQPAKDYGAFFFNAFTNEDDRTVAPVIVYYSTQRLFKDANLSRKQKYDNANGRRNGYLLCLDESGIKQTLDDWLGKAATNAATFKIKEINKTDLVYNNVEEAIRNTLIDFLGLPRDFPLKIYQNAFFDYETFVSYDEEHDLPLSYYSDGFRNLLFLVIDLIWRASELNPWLRLEEIKQQVNGVIIIDEIDLHLHPKWQAKAISLLQSFLPNAQFFITTHSPTVVANFQNGTLYGIGDNEINKYSSKYFGKDIDDVLRNILGAPDRNIETQKKLDNLYQSIDLDTEETNTLLNELSDLSGADDPEIIRAKSLIDWDNYKKAHPDAIH